mmetsp:Transcript_16276/g.51150  ORF Transcript_16276/g.51150 Transcript_16276/m.51150 type:complete len:208 (-) Transcript_16276:171-794(-)
MATFGARLAGWVPARHTCRNMGTKRAMLSTVVLLASTWMSGSSWRTMLSLPCEVLQKSSLCSLTGPAAPTSPAAARAARTRPSWSSSPTCVMRYRSTTLPRFLTTSTAPGLTVQECASSSTDSSSRSTPSVASVHLRAGPSTSLICSAALLGAAGTAGAGGVGACAAGLGVALLWFTEGGAVDEPCEECVRSIACCSPAAWRSPRHW